MKQFPEKITFKYPWRKYQQRVLGELNDYLDDKHLHIIAPPGSGKTVLGLEVALRLNKPTLIFAPTIAIRDQWVERFRELFLQEEITPEWISKDIRKPSFLTVSTYQGLFSALSGESSEDLGDVMSGMKTDNSSIIPNLKAQEIAVIIMDEAHHLKNAWWNALYEIKTALNPTIVGLTATPPYDVSYAEWQRYSELNGAVDAEISVPELVVEGDLCPHQDYVYFSLPSENERTELEKQRRKAWDLFNELIEDKTLREHTENHPFILNPEESLSGIYNNLEFYSSMLIYLNAAGYELSKKSIEITGNKAASLPKLDYSWMEIFLTEILSERDSYFAPKEAYREKLMNKLKRAGAMEHSRVTFSRNSKLDDFLGSSISKLNSIQKIAEFEYGNLGHNLRLVVLSDYIRKEFLSNGPENEIQLTKIGVVPIFEQLRRNLPEEAKLGILSGSLIIVPTDTISTIERMHSKIHDGELKFRPLPYDSKYSILEINEQSRKSAVHIITEIFQQGEIEILIGTKSLLGEGWDAPAINTLIMASFVGSYVLSNQMRGRAIRTNIKDPLKTGNIWHLVCIDPTAPDGGNDMTTLRRRFKAFVGTSLNEELYIQNGISRLQVNSNIKIQQDADYQNRRMMEFATQRDKLRHKWEDTLKNGSLLIEEIKTPFPQDGNYRQLKTLYTRKTLANMAGLLASGVLGFSEFFFQTLFRSFHYFSDPKTLVYLLLSIGGTGILIFGWHFRKYLRLTIRYRDISKDIHNIGVALIRTLYYRDFVKTDISKLNVVTNTDSTGAVYCTLDGGSSYERSLFIKSLTEIIDEVKEPRYIIIRKSRFMAIFGQKDYHAVPEVLARKNDDARDFRNNWTSYVGRCEMLYTKSVEGRKILLQSKFKSLAAQFNENTERINRWK